MAEPLSSLTKEFFLRQIASIWMGLAVVLGLAALVGLIRISPLLNPLTPNWPSLLREDFIGAISITLTLFALSTTVQVAVALLVVSYIGSIGTAYSLLLVVPFSVGVAAPATIAQALLSPQLSDTFLASMQPLATSLGVATVLVLFDTWQWVGLLILAMSLRLKYHEPFLWDAAAIDGFGRRQTISWLVFPACKPVIILYVLLKALDWLRKEDLLKALVGDLGGPEHTNRTTALLLSSWYYRPDEQRPLAAVCIALQVAVLALIVRWVLRTKLARQTFGLSEHDN